ncbi:MAG: RNA polymerase sigma factor [Planctomycetota bacterium]
MSIRFDPNRIRRAREGDRAALESLWLEHRGWIASVVRAHAPRDSEVDDLVQEVAVRFVRGIGGLSEVAAFAGWLRTIAVNVARSTARKSIGRPKTIEVDRDLPDASNATRQSDRERLELTLQVIETLEPDLREALLLKSLHGFSQIEIAHALGVRETTVESRLARARQALRSALAALDQDSRHHPLRRVQGWTP